MWRYLIAVVMLAATACKDHETNLSGDDPVSAKDLLTAFKPLETPLKYADTGLKNLGDTLHISNKVLSQFIPDSMLTRLLGKDAAKFIIQPAGKIEKEEKETYLLVKFTHDKKIKLAAFVMNTKDTVVSGIELLSNYAGDGYAHTVSITDEPTFILNREKGAGDKLLYTKNGFAYNEASEEFSIIVNDTNEDPARVNEIINPIDTFPRRNKYSGDYASDAKNFISIRDGKNDETLLFFFHFDKNNSECTGEMKQEMTIVSPGKAVFHENGDPCTINFTISNNSIHIEEEGNCGNYRGITCLIDYTYPKKKEKKTAVKK